MASVPQNNDPYESSLEKPPQDYSLPTSQEQPYTVLPTEINCFSDSTMSKEEIREALIQHANNNIFLTKNMVQSMEIEDVVTTRAFKYTLQTFVETREVVKTQSGFDGGNLDTAENGIQPEFWSIMQMPPEMFEFGVKNSEIPYTASVENCNVCNGIRKSKCRSCRGSCKRNCPSCGGIFQLFSSEKCPQCGGKSLWCSKCNGSGEINCRTCEGKGRMKHFKKLITTWRNHEDDILINKTNLPNKLIRYIRGHKAFQETSPLVHPVSQFPEDINEAFSALLFKHKQLFPNERIIYQKHQVEVIPISQIEYCLKGRSGVAFIYGLENKVHFSANQRPFLSKCNICIKSISCSF